MELTTGAILRHITHADLSNAAHKLATLILDGIAWKEGYNGLSRGTAAFTLADLAERMRITRQHLHTLLTELSASRIRLVRHRGRGKLAAWLFRFECCDADDREPSSDMSTTDDTSPYIRDSNKNVFSGTIMLNCSSTNSSARWVELIRDAKAALPCRGADSRHIWDRFREFNRRRGHETVPAGYLLGFMHKWRSGEREKALRVTLQPCPAISSQERELQQLIVQAPFVNRYFHEIDLKRAIGADRYDAQTAELQTSFGCSEFRAKLALHGLAIAAGTIRR